MPDRRAFLLAAGLVAAGGLAGCASTARPGAAGPADPAGPATLVPTHPTPAPRPPAPAEVAVDKVPTTCVGPARVTASLTAYDPPALTTPVTTAPSGSISALTDDTDHPGNAVALTVDDGLDSDVVAAYVAFAQATGIRLTFFVNGLNPSWTEHAALLRPLVESGQVQLGNHTWSHPDVTKLGRSALADQIDRNHTFIMNTYGVDPRPFFRPPYGFHNGSTDRVAADHGYDTITMWYGTFGDAAVLSETRLLGLAQQWIKPGAIVIGHANHPTVTHLYPQLLDIIREQSLHTVTLADVYRPA